MKRSQFNLTSWAEVVEQLKARGIHATPRQAAQICRRGLRKIARKWNPPTAQQQWWDREKRRRKRDERMRERRRAVA